MSADKHKLHDRAMILYSRICKRYDPLFRCGLQYCSEGGIGPSPELDYLLDRKMVKIVRPRSSSRRISYLKPYEDGEK